MVKVNSIYAILNSKLVYKAKNGKYTIGNLFKSLIKTQSNVEMNIYHYQLLT